MTKQTHYAGQLQVHTNLSAIVLHKCAQICQKYTTQVRTNLSALCASQMCINWSALCTLQLCTNLSALCTTQVYKNLSALYYTSVHKFVRLVLNKFAQISHSLYYISVHKFFSFVLHKLDLSALYSTSNYLSYMCQILD